MKKVLLPAFALLAASMNAHSQVVQLNNNSSLSVKANIGSKAIYASAKDSILWVTDGTPVGTKSLGNAVKFDDDGSYGVINNKLVFSGQTAAGGTELWITDGTVGGTVLLKEIYDGPLSSLPGGPFAPFNGKLYFTAQTVAEGRELWMTDGTPGGTTIVKDILEGPQSSNEIGDYNLDISNGLIYFSATNGTSGKELWKSDGTPGGTVLLKDLDGNGGSSSPDQFFTYGSITLFTAEPNGDNELWRTDGTNDGTYLVKNINPLAVPLPVGSNPASFLLFKNKVYFTADGTSAIGNNTEVWVTDGTEANTHILKDINLFGGAFAFLSNAIIYPDKFIFSAYNITYGLELWQTDGTTDGTVLFKDVLPGDEGSNAIPLLPIDLVSGFNHSNLFQGNKFFFVATTENEGSELWISDGTPDGTHILKDINAGEGDGYESLSYIQTANKLYFVANDGISGEELWKTDGTENGTVIAADINVGPGSSNARISTVLGNKLLLEASDDGDEINTDLYRFEDDLVLPVKLLSFNGTKENNEVRLHWKATATGTSRFEVEKSFDGKLYTRIASVLPAGNGSATDYSTTDVDAKINTEPIIYYRLKIVANDGVITYSPIITIQQQLNNATIAKMAKNPVRDAIELSINHNGSLQYELVGNSGTVLKTGNFTGSGYLSIDTRNMAAGVYYLKLIGKNTLQSMKVLKQ